MKGNCATTILIPIVLIMGAVGSLPEGSRARFYAHQSNSAANRAADSVPTGWQMLETGAFSISAPSGWEFHQLMGVDSYVGEFVGDGVVLTFDFGRYSNSLKKEKKPAYVIAHESIGGFRAKVVSPRAPGHGITAVYFHNVGRSNGLCLWGRDLSAAHQELALRIFGTIRFLSPEDWHVSAFPLPPPKSQ